MQVTDIYLVRHGQAEANIAQVLMGHTDSPLSDTGKAEAMELKKKLAHVRFDIVASSDLSRAVDTAKLLAGTDANIQQFPELRERSFGTFEGRQVSGMRSLFDAHAKLPPAQQWTTSWANRIESDEQIYERVVRCLERIAEHNTGKKILVVTHGGPIRAMLIGSGFYPEGELPPGSFKHGGFVHLSYEDHTFQLLEQDGVGDSTISSE